MVRTRKPVSMPVFKLTNLPPLALHQILIFLNDKELLILSHICRVFYTLVDEVILNIFHRGFIEPVTKIKFLYRMQPLFNKSLLIL